MADDSAIAGGRVKRSRPAVKLARPVAEFLQTETAGGIALLAAVILALVWANSPWSGSYETFWTSEIELTAGPLTLGEELRHWVNDALMVIFFFIVGMEIKRELVSGDLSTWRQAALPVAAAIGGMVVPAAIYLLFNLGGKGSQGWGIPMATDIALALGALALLSRFIPPKLRLMLLSLAIVDDVGAILVIAAFYTNSINWIALGIGAVLILVILALRMLKVWWIPVYVAVGIAFWFAVFESGVHATIAGVILGLLAPAEPLKGDALKDAPLPQEESAMGVEEEEDEQEIAPEEAHETRFRVTAAVAPTERLTYLLHPWSSFLILPIFALANAGIPLTPKDLIEAASSPVGLGIVAGLLIGKIVGVSAFAALAKRFKARLPEGVTMRDVVGMAALAGIGFTMSLFISGLAFQEAEVTQQAKVGILMGSIASAAVAAAIFASSGSEE